MLICLVEGLSCERLGSGNSQTELNCTVGNTINDINITIHEVYDACSTTDDVLTETIKDLDSASYTSCIGHNSCILTDKTINVSNSDTSNNHHHLKNPNTVCPYTMESIACGSTNRKIEIKSVEMMPYLSVCEKPVLNNSCIELIQQKVNTSCNGKQNCEPQIWNQSVFTWDDCIRIPKFYNISFSCVKAISPHVSLQDETNVVSVAVGVTVGLITIVGVIVVFIWFVRRKVSDDEQNTTNKRDENKYSIGNKNTAIPSDSNYEILTTDQESRSYDELKQDFRKQPSRDQPDINNKEMENEYIIPCPVTQQNKSKKENEDQTVNHVESNIGIGIREHTQSSLSNSANYFTVL
ncbi:unnamed protein product [Mytilus edulis]|uniref:SUEL-type lectin domain-containing protein n=1 Tax=Mytilus edulis TaxID=6550 RepID=A0A8S3V995_MYTED|nr:unnamed protein product [Mytilus edulis]